MSLISGSGSVDWDSVDMEEEMSPHHLWDGLLSTVVDHQQNMESMKNQNVKLFGLRNEQLQHKHKDDACFDSDDSVDLSWKLNISEIIESLSISEDEGPKSKQLTSSKPNFNVITNRKQADCNNDSPLKFGLKYDEELKWFYSNKLKSGKTEVSRNKTDKRKIWSVGSLRYIGLCRSRLGTKFSIYAEEVKNLSKYSHWKQNRLTLLGSHTNTRGKKFCVYAEKVGRG